MNNQTVTPRKNTKKRFSPLDIACLVVTALVHIAAIVLVVFSYQYYGLSKGAYISLIAIIVCLLLICDLLLIVGLRYKDKVIAIINCVLASLLLIACVTGAIVFGKVNHVVNQVVENTGKDQYESISGVFVCYDNDYAEIADIDGKTVGILKETNVGTGSIAKELLDKEKVDYDIVELDSINDLFYGLIDETIDVAAMPSSYRQLFENNEDYDYTEELESMNDFFTFEKKVKVAENEKANIDLTAEPFNILLIGFAQNDAYSKYGLADTIIVATVNPQTMTVTLTSIARDSYVPISCYGGGKEKINAARGTSRACLLETVSDLLDMDINFYMEVNFEAVVKIVDAIGGIMIDSPVTFVGQNSSYTRGEMTVLVPEGPHMAMGEEALAFARERHAMPGGDFDRQEHQQEVIKEIAKGLVELRDVSKALKIMEACGENISTNLSIEQLTNVFNYIVSAPNYLDVNQFDMIDIQNMRMTGYSSWHYNEGLGLKLWIYKLYQGSIDECLDRINGTLGKFDTIDQKNRFYFFAGAPYTRGRLYSLSFSESEQHEIIPFCCPNFVGLTYDEAVALASQNGLSLQVTTITSSDEGFDESKMGYVVSQGIRSGAVMPDGTTVVPITVMGTMSSENLVPNFVGKLYTVAVDWAQQNGYAITLDKVTEGAEGKYGQVISTNPGAGSNKSQFSSITIKYYAAAGVDVSLLVGKTEEEAKSWVNANLYYPGSVTYQYVSAADNSQVGKVKSAIFSDIGTTMGAVDNTHLVIEIYKEQTQTFTLTVNSNGGGTVSGSGSYANGTRVAVSAIPNSGYHFVSWSDGGAQTHDVTINGEDKTVTATFEADVTPTSTYSVTVSCGDGGTVSGNASGLADGTTVHVVATPLEGYHFVNWSDNGAQEHDVTINGDNISLIAEFALNESPSPTEPTQPEES